jgi:hypothetical protein
MEAMAIGIEESVQDDHIRARIGQVRYLGELLQDWGVPIVQPVGGHAVFLDARRRFYPHLPQDQFPAQTLAAELYLDSGIRAMERGIVSPGATRRPATTATPSWSWCASPSRAASTPRRTWTWWPSRCKAVYDARENVRGLKMVYEPKYLRFFQARFERDLDPDKLQALGGYLASWVTWLREREGFPVRYLSLHNEGDKPHNWPADGLIQVDDIFDYNTFWPPALLSEFISTLRPYLDSQGLQEIGITPGECSSWAHFHERLYDWHLAANPQTLESLGLITCHSFGAASAITPAGVQHLRRFRPELPAWVSSASWGNQDMHLAEHISRNINQVRVNGYIPWACVQTPSQWKDGMDPNAAPPIRISENGSYEVLSTYALYKQFSSRRQAGNARGAWQRRQPTARLTWSLSAATILPTQMHSS